jgi:hypothetical protein
MPEPAFLVDGVMEQKILAKICNGKKVLRTNCNGRDVAMKAIARRVATLSRLLKNYDPIIVLIDREERQEDCKKLLAELAGELTQAGYPGRFILGMADRMIENWILADWESVRAKFSGLKGWAGQAEGCHGKHQVKSLMPNSRRYNEVSEGVKYFSACDPSNIYAKSVSFKDFVDQIQVDCWWTARVKLN